MPRRDFNNQAYRARARRAQRQQALQQAQRRLIQQLRRNQNVPTSNTIQHAVLILGNRTIPRAQAQYNTPQIAQPLIPSILLNQQEIPIAQRIVNPREEHNRYMRALGLNPNFRPSN